MTAVDSAREEIDAALVVNKDLLEGARHLTEQADLIPESRAEAQQMVEDYDRRNNLLKSAQSALQALDRDNYPDNPVREVDEDIVKDIQQNIDTLLAVRAKLASNSATSLGLKGGGSLPKENP